MKQGELLYFTPAEFIVMMELSGAGKYSMLRAPGLQAGKDDLVQAFSSLFRRGMLLRQGDRLVPAGEGRVFAEMKRARFAVLALSQGSAAVFYVGREALWLAELAESPLAACYRLGRVDRGGLRRWLEDAGMLETPALCDADARELGQLFEDELDEPSGRVLLRLERARNGGTALCVYELLMGKSGKLLTRADGQERTAQIYTQEALTRMLEECFEEDGV